MGRLIAAATRPGQVLGQSGLLPNGLKSIDSDRSDGFASTRFLAGIDVHVLQVGQRLGVAMTTMFES